MLDPLPGLGIEPGAGAQLANAALGPRVVVAQVALAGGDQHVPDLGADGEGRAADEVGAIGVAAQAAGEAHPATDLLARPDQVAGLQGAEVGDPADHPGAAHGRAGALVDDHLAEQLGIDVERPVALLVAALLVVLAHAVDRHVDPPVVLDATDVHRQAGVLLAHRGVHPGVSSSMSAACRGGLRSICSRPITLTECGVW